jgi:predicted DNA-binding protein
VRPEVDVSKILPPKQDEGELVTTSLRMPRVMIERLDSIAKESGYSRTEVMLHFVRWAIQEYEAEKKAGKR